MSNNKFVCCDDFKALDGGFFVWVFLYKSVDKERGKCYNIRETEL